MPGTIYRSDTAVVLHVDLTPDASREADALASLDERELARRARILTATATATVHPVPRGAPDRALPHTPLFQRRIVLRRVHGTESPSPWSGGVPASIAFNVSHSGRHGLIALAPEGQIGVDVEERSARRDIDGDIRLLFAPEERARLNSADGPRRLELFWSLWTMKEALVKASGTGLARDTSSFTIPPAMDLEARRTVFQFPDTPSTRWQLEKLDSPCFAAALAYEMPAASRPGSRTRDEAGARGPGS